jgi:hypothetical protein
MYGMTGKVGTLALCAALCACGEPFTSGLVFGESDTAGVGGGGHGSTTGDGGAGASGGGTTSGHAGGGGDLASGGAGISSSAAGGADGGGPTSGAGGASPGCGPDTCAGCCDAQGACQVGLADDRCGAQGAACVECQDGCAAPGAEIGPGSYCNWASTVYMACVAGVCVPKDDGQGFAGSCCAFHPNQACSVGECVSR